MEEKKWIHLASHFHLWCLGSSDSLSSSFPSSSPTIEWVSEGSIGGWFMLSPSSPISFASGVSANPRNPLEFLLLASFSFTDQWSWTDLPAHYIKQSLLNIPPQTVASSFCLLLYILFMFYVALSIHPQSQVTQLVRDKQEISFPLTWAKLMDCFAISIVTLPVWYTPEVHEPNCIKNYNLLIQKLH